MVPSEGGLSLGVPLYCCRVAGGGVNSPAKAPTETEIWSYIVQLCSALRCIHGSGLAARTIEPTKILQYGKGRWVRITAVLFSHCQMLSVFCVTLQQGMRNLTYGYAVLRFAGLSNPSSTSVWLGRVSHRLCICMLLRLSDALYPPEYCSVEIEGRSH